MKKIDKTGTVRYINSNGFLHRVGLFAFKYSPNYTLKYWFFNGMNHRLNNSAIYEKGVSYSNYVYDKRIKINIGKLVI